jgi:hypothetical protein
MIVTGKSLPRRAVLRGLGTTLALPLLDAMVPAFSGAVRAATPIPRLGFFYVPNGIQVANLFPQGDALDVTPILTPLQPLFGQVVVISGLANKAADNIDISAGGHSRAHATWLSGARAKRTEGADVQCGPTIDQQAARVLGKDTPLENLLLALEPNFLVGNCESGYSCVYGNTFSWKSPTVPVPMETNPRVVFDRLFGAAGTPEARVGRMREDRSILDAVAEEMASLKRTLGASDNRTVDEYADSVREVEQRLQKIEKRAMFESDAERPIGIPASYDDHARLMLDLLFLAYQADITRVAGFQIARESSARSYPQVGVEESHHELSHHGYNAEKIAKHTKINTYHMGLFAEFAKKMAATADGDGTLLDHSLLLYGGGMGDGDLHSPHNLPVVLAGNGCGTLKGGRFIKAKMETPMMNLGLSLLDRVGIELPSIGDSTGRLSEL